MTFQGYVRNGVVILDSAPNLPEGTPVRVEVIETADASDQGRPRRQGGQYAGQIHLAADFDQWPPDLQEALGMVP